MAEMPHLRAGEPKPHWEFGPGYCAAHGIPLATGVDYCWRCLAREVDDPDIRQPSLWWNSGDLLAICPVCGFAGRACLMRRGMCRFCRERYRL